MKKIVVLIFVLLLGSTLCACGGEDYAVQRALNHPMVSIKESPDKYTWYIRDYVGRNLASFGKGTKDRYEEYGNGEIYFTFVSTDGSLISKTNLEDYIVVAQSVEPNTELKYQYQKMSDGTEYDTLIETQNIERIELKVAKLTTKSDDTSSKDNNMTEKAKEAMNHTPTPIKASPDKYTWYIKDYVGRRLNSCGTARLGGFLMDDYGAGGIEFVILTDDGSDIDIDDEETLKNYIVTAQGIAPNSEIKYIFDKRSDGTEYDNLLDYQSIEEMELYVTKIYQ